MVSMGKGGGEGGRGEGGDGGRDGDEGEEEGGGEEEMEGVGASDFTVLLAVALVPVRRKEGGEEWGQGGA